MEIKVTHKCLLYNGKVKNISNIYHYPHDEGNSYTIMSFIDDIDKREWMNENNVHIIIDYWLAKEKVKKVTFGEYLKDYFKKTDEMMSDEYKEIFVGDFLAAYSAMKDSLDGLSNEKKVKIVLSTLNTTYMGQLNILKITNVEKIEE